MNGVRATKSSLQACGVRFRVRRGRWSDLEVVQMTINILKNFIFSKKNTQFFRFCIPHFQNIRFFFVCGVKELFFQFGWGRDEFLGEVQAQSSRREASTQSMLDFLDTFSNTN
jgi:hypothetical protein